MIIDDIALALETGLDLAAKAHLISCFGSAEAVYAASSDMLISKAELREKLAESVPKKLFHTKALEQLRHVHRHKIKTLIPSDEYYPPLLREINDMPIVLYALGDVSCLSSRMITMVGTRHITSYGQRVCNLLIEKLSEKFPDLVIVSGLAYGIDAECHRAAIRCGLRTVGVVKDVLPEITPAGNHLLASSILSSGGCIISESTLFSPKHKGEYIKRNRIMAAMSEGTVLVEAMEKGGANSTARIADSYGRTVMAVPGRIDDKSSVGTNRMIANHLAHMIYSGDDVARELGWASDAVVHSADSQDVEYSEVQQKILEVIPRSAVVYVDYLAQQTGLDMGELQAELFELELLGALRSLPGSRYERS